MEADSISVREIPVEEVDATSMEISNLTPFTSYNFSISAETKAGSGPPASISSRTPEAGKIRLLHYHTFSKSSAQNKLKKKN